MIYIILPTYTRVDHTKNFLNSISNAVDKEYLVLIIDDHPNNVTFKSLEKTKNINILTPEKELWWVGSINIGIATLLNAYNLQENDIVIFANNDVEIDKNSFNILYTEIENNNKQIVHPRTLDQDNREVSSGTLILSYFPYISSHPKKIKEEKRLIDMATARFLMMSGKTLKKVGFINQELLQYLGDNDFSLKAKRLHNINTFIIRDSVCRLDDMHTGIKNNNIKKSKKKKTTPIRILL